MKKLLALVIVALFSVIGASPTTAAVGDTLAVVQVPVPSETGLGIGIAVDCEDPANLYYTNSFTPTLYKMTSAGVLIDSTPIIDAATGNPISFGAISWDDNRKVLWGGTDNSGNPVSIYQIDPATGQATFQFTAQTPWIGFTDGIAYDATDDSLWVSDDVSSVIDHHDASTGAFLGSITPTNAAGDILGSISGVLVGKGDLLYLGRNGFGEIVQVKKSDGSFIGVFATPGGRDEDLACDVVSFPGKTVIWSKDAYNDTITAIEVEPGTCECQVCDPNPLTQGYWHRQCLGIPASEGGIAPGRNGRGPGKILEPGFVEKLIPCADAKLEELGFFGIPTCEGLDANPANDPCEKALKQLTALILNVCSGRLTNGCEVDVSTEGGSSTNVGDLIMEITTLIHDGSCQQAAGLAAAVNEGWGLIQ